MTIDVVSPILGGGKTLSHVFRMQKHEVNVHLLQVSPDSPPGGCGDGVI